MKVVISKVISPAYNLQRGALAEFVSQPIGDKLPYISLLTLTLQFALNGLTL